MCDGCAQSIKRALGRDNGVSNVQVDIDQKLVTVTHDADSVPVSQLVDALDRAGFPATVRGA
jgi:copper chaperone CopZ